MVSSAITDMLDVVFSDPNLATTGNLIMPASMAFDCRVLFASVSDPVAGGLGGFQSSAEHLVAEILVREVPIRPTSGSSLTIVHPADGTLRTYRVGSAAEPARNGMTWRMTLSDD